MSLSMVLPLAAVAVAPNSADDGMGQRIAIAEGDLTKVRGNFDKVGDASGLNTGTRELPDIIGGILNFFLGLLGVILVVIVIYAGYKWMTASGNSQQVDEAKKMITQAVIGIVIVMAAYAITNFVLNAVLKSTVESSAPAAPTP